jgi:hypothetical protein
MFLPEGLLTLLLPAYYRLAFFGLAPGMLSKTKPNYAVDLPGCLHLAA